MSSSSDKKTSEPDEVEIRGYASPPCFLHELDPNYLGGTGSDDGQQPGTHSSWSAIRAWRVKTRLRLIDFRNSLTASELQQRATNVARNLREAGVLAGHQGIGFYWPMAGEIDLRPLITDLVECGIDTALPVITEKDRPLEFWQWRPGDVLDESGPLGIPVPATRQPVEVAALLIPLVGFDDQGHRLGHGGGYYDRTLADRLPRPMAVGIGFEECRLPSIFPQAHDMPMDLMVTDAGAYKTDDNLAKILPVTA